MNVNNITDVKAQTSGALYAAPAGTALPTDASTALAADFKQLGYADKAGLTISIDRDIVQWDSWEADDVVRVSESQNVEIGFTLMEPFSEQAAKLLFGPGNVTASGGAVSKIAITDDDLPEVVLVAEMLLRNGDKMRLVCGRFQVTETGEMTLQRGEYARSEVTGAALGSGSADKVSFYFA